MWIKSSIKHLFSLRSPMGPHRDGYGPIGPDRGRRGRMDRGCWTIVEASGLHESTSKLLIADMDLEANWLQVLLVLEGLVITAPYGPPFRSWKIAGYWLFCDSVIEWPITNQIGYKMMPITNKMGYSWKCQIKYTNLTFPNGPEANKYWRNALAHPSISLPFELQMALAMTIANF